MSSGVGQSANLLMAWRCGKKPVLALSNLIPGVYPHNYRARLLVFLPRRHKPQNLGPHAFLLFSILPFKPHPSANLGTPANRARQLK